MWLCPSEDQEVEQQLGFSRGGAVHWPYDAAGRLGINMMPQNSPTLVLVVPRGPRGRLGRLGVRTNPSEDREFGQLRAASSSDILICSA